MIGLLALLACGEAEPDTTSPPTPAPAEAPPLVEEGPLPEQVAARHILVKVKPAQRGTEAEVAAQQKIQDALARLEAGEDFRLVAAEVSDDGSAKRGGWLGTARYEEWVPEFSEVAFRLEVGERSGIVESKFGYHIIQRETLDSVRLQQIVVRFEGAQAAKKLGVTRSREDALARAEEARAAVDAGMAFEEAARSFSEGPMAERGGDMGVVLRGELGDAVDEAISELEVGELSEPVETPFGFHVLKRLE